MDAIRTIFLDYGNVIAFFDHARASRRLAELAQRHHDDFHAILYANPRFDELEGGRLPTDDYVRQVLAELAWECDRGRFNAIYGDIFTPNPPVCALVPELAKTHRLVLASNTNALHADFFQPQFADVFRHFDKLVFSHEVGARKPEAEFYQRCQEFAGCEPRQCLFVDDRADNIDAARRHGWNVVHMTDFDALRRGLREFGVYNDL